MNPRVFPPLPHHVPRRRRPGRTEPGRTLTARYCRRISRRAGRHARKEGAGGGTPPSGRRESSSDRRLLRHCYYINWKRTVNQAPASRSFLLVLQSTLWHRAELTNDAATCGTGPQCNAHSGDMNPNALASLLVADATRSRSNLHALSIPRTSAGSEPLRVDMSGAGYALPCRSNNTGRAPAAAARRPGPAGLAPSGANS